MGRSWHAEIGIPVAQLSGPLAFYRNVFPGARVIMFGYGKKTFFTAPPDTISEYILGPFPGTAVIHTVGLRIVAPEAYRPEDTVTLSLPSGGMRALSEFIWNDLSKDAQGNVRVVAHSYNPEGVFYAARSEYDLLHTCNTWTAEALHAAGLNVSANAVAFSSQVMAQASSVASDQCQFLMRH